MEDMKIVAEDVIEEHNGVYGGKWHIISLEGFDLPEGLDYLRNSWEGMYGEKRFQKYIATMQINNVQLDEAIKRVTSLLDEFAACHTDVEIINSPGESNNGFANPKFLPYIHNFTLHGCVLTFEDLYEIMTTGPSKSGGEFSLSQNIFKNKDWEFVYDIKDFFDRNKQYRGMFKSFDLRCCNFSSEEQKYLREAFRHLSVLI